MSGQTTPSPASEPGPEKLEILDIDDDAPRPAVKKHDTLPISKDEKSAKVPAQTEGTGAASEEIRPAKPRSSNQGADISGPFVTTIFISSIAGLGFAGVEMIRTKISHQGAIEFIGAWALIASILLTLSYLAARHRKIAGFFNRSGMHMLCATITFSSVTIAAIMLAFMYRPAVGSIVHKAADTETMSPEKNGSELLSSFEKLELKRPRFSEHFYTPPTSEGNPPFRRTAPVLEEPKIAPVDPILMQEVQNKLAAKIEPTATKPDRKVKAENPPLKKTVKKKKKKKKKVVSKRKKSRKVTKKRRVASVTRKPAQQLVKTTPLVITNKSAELIDKNQPDCMGMKSVRSAKCADQR